MSDTLHIKSAAEIELMRESGRLLARVFKHLDGFIGEDVTTMAINNEVERFIREELNARPASLGQYDYPYVLNASVDEEVCHGMPKDNYAIRPRDIINIDITLEKNGFIADSSKMYVMPNAGPEPRRLVKTAYAAMWEGIRQVKPGATLGDIGHAIESYARGCGYSVVEEYCGHGIGREMHEAPQILHVGKPGRGMTLQLGMTFTIEPMINQGRAKTKTKKDGWTVVTADRKLSAQWEHTILVTDSGFEVLTLREGEQPN
jgi:methionyl aminopeptidase